MWLVQFLDETGTHRVGQVDIEGPKLTPLTNVTTVYELISSALTSSRRLQDVVAEASKEKSIDYQEVYRSGRVLPPIDHPDAAHLWVTGTGLDHLGSAQTRNSMHAQQQAEAENITDSMRMFQWGLEGGKPGSGKVGVAPEWFYKGNGNCVVGPGQPLRIPSFGEDGGEEAELAGVYVISPEGDVVRVGYTIGNEFSDHVIEKQNYLYLAHSKLRACSFGPELYIGDLPDDVTGKVRVLREGKEVWSAPLATGEANMTHSLENIQHHHFKYELFRHPGDVHVHFMGASSLSVSAGVKAEAGDVFEISSSITVLPLANPLEVDNGPETLVRVRVI